MTSSTSPPSHSTPAASSNVHAPKLSPASLDTIPVLTSILSRLTILTAGASSGAPGSTPAAAGSVAGDGPLNIKDIPAATDSLRHMLAKARTQTQQLPDIDREIREQEEEIEELLKKIERQRAVLEGLRSTGLKFVGEKGDRMEI